MDPWKAEDYSEFYSKHEMRCGLRMHYTKSIDGRLKIFLADFGRWLRKNSHFPVRVNVYFKDATFIRAMDGESVSATFFGPFDRLSEPYIRIAVGDFDPLVREKDLFNALCAAAASLAHELTHYYQWLNDMRLTERQEERQACYYSRKIVYMYLDDGGYDLTDILSENAGGKNNSCKSRSDVV